MFGSGKIRVIIGSWVLATAVLAVPPGSPSEPPASSRIVATQVPADAGPAAESGSPGQGGRPSARGWLPYLKAGLVALLLLGQAPVVDTQPGLGPASFGPPPAVNLSAPDPVSLMVAQGLGMAMGRANDSGGLPSLPEINSLMAQYRPMGAAVLATLPASAITPEADPPLASDSFSYASVGEELPEQIRPQLPSFLLNYPPNQPYSYSTQNDLATKLVAAQTDLNVAQLTTGFYLLEALGNEFIGLGTPLLLVNETLGLALETVGFQLAAFGFLTASQASSLNIQRAQDLVDDLKKQQAQANATARAQAHALINPNVLYGSWLWEPDQPSNVTLIYQFGPTEFVRINSTLEADGLESTEIDRYPGGITTRISYRHPPRNASAADAVGRISVQMLVPMDGAPAMLMKFYYLRVKGDQIGRTGEQEFDALVEQEGARMLFVKVSK